MKFRGKYNFLSNFHEIDIIYNGIKFKSVEHAYQALKADNYDDMIFVAESETPAISKIRGRNIPVRKDWKNVKILIMRDLLYKKFEDGYLKEKLIKTGDISITEENSWGDTFWGIDEKTNKGRNELGKLLEEIRDKITNRQNTLGKMLFGRKKRNI